MTAAGTQYVNPVSGSIGFTLVTSGGAGTGSGSGYLTAPQVVLSGGGGSGATATATINAKNQVATVNLTNAGTGYTSAPTVTFVPDSTVSGATVVDGGSGYVTGDVVTFTGGGGTGAVGKVSAVTIAAGLTLGSVNGGSGYTLPPTVTLTNVGAAPTLAATVTASLTSSTLIAGTTDVTLTGTANANGSYGSGFTAPTATVSVPQVTGTTATATPIVGFALAVPATFPASPGGSWDPTTTVINVNLPDLQGGVPPSGGTVTVDPILGTITGITFATPGSGYSVAPTATISDGLFNSATMTLPLAAGSGQIFGVKITGVGSGYTAPATVKITDATGTGAPVVTAAVATVANGTTPSYLPIGVVKLTVNNPGQGYTAAPTVALNPAAGDATAPAAGTANAASATLAMGQIIGSITGVTMTSVGSGYLSAPAVSVTSANGAGANLTAGLLAAGVGAQATVVTSTSSAPVVQTKAEQELWDDYGRYNSTGGVELPYTTASIQTTIPLNYIDAPTEVIGDGEVQIWKLVDNGFWSNSIHFNMANVQLINRVGWDGTVKAPASNEVGWKDTLRLNPLEDVIVAVQGKRATAPFGQPRSTRLQDPLTLAGAPTAPAAPAALTPGVQYASGLGFTADPNVVQPAGMMASAVLPGGPGDALVAVNKVLLTTTTNTNVLPASPTSNYDNEFLWGSAILGHGTDDFQRPVVFNPTVVQPDASALADLLGTGTLTWNDPTPTSTPATTLANPKNEIGYAMLQAPITNINKNQVGAWTPMATPFASLPANTVSYAEPAALVAPNLPTYYAYQLVAYNAAGATPSNAVFEAPPAAPTGLVLTPSFIANATTTSDVTLTAQWQDLAINETNYIVTKTDLTAASAPTVITTPPNTNVATPTTTWVDPAALVEGDTYQYDVIARNSFGDSTPVLSGTVKAPISVPLAPTVSFTQQQVTCPATVPVRCAPDDVLVSWTDNAFNETSYTVARAGGNVPFTTVTLPASALNVSGGTMTYTDTTAQEGVAYTYTVSAVNAVGAGSASVNVTEAVTAPTVPTNLVVTPATTLDANGMYTDTANLSWSDNAYNEAGYQITRTVTAPANLAASTPPVVINVAGSSANNPMGTKTASWTASPTLSYTDTGLIDGVTYSWSVAGVNATAPAGGPAAAFGKAMPGIVIASPTALAATPNRTGLSIGLSWTDNSTNETDWMVEESVSTNNGVSFGPWIVANGSPMASNTTASTGTRVNFNRANVATTPGTIYNFRVSARNLANHSDSHPYAFATANLNAPVLNSAPTLAVPTISANGRVTLTWTAVTPPAGTTISYLINGVAVNPLPTGALTYSYRPGVAALQAGLTFSVQAVATAIRVANPTVFGTTVGPISNVQTFKATAPAAPAMPTGLAATIAAATGAVTLNWTAVTPAAGTTISYLAIIDGAAPVAITRGAAVALATGTTHTVSIASVATALGLSTTSAYTAPLTIDLTAAAVPNAPATLTVSATTLNWTAPAALAGTVSTNVTYTYNVQKSVDGGLTWTLLTPTPITARTLAAASPAGTNYQYSVQAMATRYGLPTSAPSAWKTTTFNTAALVSTGVTNALAATPARTFNVSFTNTSLNLTGFTVQRRLGAGAWTTVAVTVTPALNTATTYSFSNTVTAAGSYTYRVAASSAAGGALVYSAASNAVTTP